MRNKIWSLLPEDATPWYIWRHMCDSTRQYYRQSYMKHRNRDTLLSELNEWYEWAYQDAIEDKQVYLKSLDQMENEWLRFFR